MTGKISGFITEVKKVCPNARHVHCIIHRENLVFEKIGSELYEMLLNVSTIVNYVKRQASSTRLFRILCKEMG